MTNSNNRGLVQGQDSDRAAKWWETAEDHRFALEVLQLKVRREILKFISSDTRSVDDVGKAFGLKRERAEYHLALLEKALVAERSGERYGLTETGRLYLEKVEQNR
jgi:hypothetical protein